jgi:hypothetical protein
MKLRTSTSTVETSGVAESTNFSMKVNGKAFKILLDGLYSDKVGAVIRELSTNAFDAHLAVGKGDVPFLVQLPSTFNPTFRVRDYGISMTHEQTMRLISTVFESSKDNSNNQVGAFGLGSKSPFSLVDSFTLTVWKDGEKRIYSAYFGADGVPALSLLGREPSTEPTGVEFSMESNPKDVSAFKEKAARILCWFPTLPIVQGQSLRLEKPKALIEGKGWQLLSATRFHVGGQPTYTDIGGACARQGCVVYPLKAEAISGLATHHAALMDAPLLIDFPIGSLDVAASRESLSYDAATCANIVARLNSVSDAITDHYGKAIQNASTLWEAGKAKRQLIRASNLPHALIAIIGETKWKGTTACDEFALDRIEAVMVAKGDPYKAYTWDTYRVRRSAQALAVDAQAEMTARRLHGALGDEDNYSFFFTLIDDRPTYEGRRIRAAIQGNQTPILFAVKDEAAAKGVLALLGDPTVYQWTKDLPTPVMAPRMGSTAKRGVTKVEEVKVRKIEKGLLSGRFEVMPEAVVPLSGDALYVITKDAMATELGPQKDYKTDIPSFLGAIGGAFELKYLDDKLPIYAISSVYQKRVEAFGKWEKVDQKVASATTTLAKDMAEELIQCDIARVLESSNWTTLLRGNPTLLTEITQAGSGPLFTLWEFLEKTGMNAVQPSLYPRRAFYQNGFKLSRLGIDIQTLSEEAVAIRMKDTREVSLNAHLQECDRMYPLIKDLGRGNSYNSNSTAGSAATEYVLAMDAYRAAKARAPMPRATVYQP